MYGIAPGTPAVHAAAWPVKQALGGGFRGGALDKRTGEMIRGEQRETLAQARYDAQTLALQLLGDANYRKGHIRRHGEWACNYWIY